MDIDIVVVGRALEFWEAHRSSIDIPLCSRDDQEWLSTEFRVWQDTRVPVFVFDLSSPVSTDMPLPADILRDYTLEFEIRAEKALADLRGCLREAVRDRDYCREIADTLTKDIEEMSNVQESKLAAFRAEFNQRGPAPPGIEAKCALVEIPSRGFGRRACGPYSEICCSRSLLG